MSTYIGISQITNLYANKIHVAQKALQTTEIKGTEDEQCLSEIVSRMSQVNGYEKLSLEDLQQMVSISAKYLACDGEMSGLRQIWTGITSPDMNLIYWIMWDTACLWIIRNYTAVL